MWMNSKRVGGDARSYYGGGMRGFFGGAARRRSLYRGMAGLGDDSGVTSWQDDLLKFASSAANIVNSQRAFNLQYRQAQATGQPVFNQSAPRAVAPRPDYTKMALIGGAGIATLFVGMKLLKR